MPEVGTGEVPIFPTFKGFRTEVVTQTDSAGAAGGNVFTRAFSGAAKGLAAGVAVGFGAAFAGAAAIGAKGLDRALNIQDAKQKLSSLGNSAGDVDTIMQNALASVKGTAFGLGDAAGVAASAVAAGIKPGEALTRTLTATANAAAIAGVPLNEMGSIINKVATNGKLTTETLQQFQDRGVPLLQTVADQYGVTADEAAKMVTDGKVNFADFQTALEKSVGDGAVGAGKTARGAFANIGAAFGRLGALFVQPAVDGAPALFTRVAGAVDRATTAAKPLADLVAAKLAPAMDALGGKVDGLNFDAAVGKIITITQGIEGLYNLVVKGDFTSGFAQAFNVTEDSGAVDLIFRIRDGITGLYDFIVKGDFTSAFSRAFNVTEDSDIVGVLFTIRTAVSDFFGSIKTAFQTGDFSGIFASLGSVGTALNPLFPIFLQVGQGLGAITGNIGGLLAAGLPLLAPIIDTFTGALGFLADNSELIAPIITGIAVAFGIYKLAQAAANVAALASLPLDAARIASTFALAGAQGRLATQMAITNGVERAGFLTRVPVVVQWLAQTAAMGANLVVQGAMRVATLAGAVATGIATGAMTLFTAVMNANPISIVVIALVALVAALIYFFTQTDLGRAIWQGFMDFLVGAWNNIVAVAQVVWQFLADVISNVWNFIVTAVTAYITMVQTIIMTVVNFIVSAWQASWQFISDVISNVWNFIVLFITTYINLVVGVITAVLGFITGAWNASWQFISDVISNVWNFIVGFVTAYINTVSSIISNVIGFITGVWNTGWNLIGQVISTVWGAITSFINGAVSGIASAISGFVSNVSNGVQDVFGFITGLPDQILGILGDLGSLLVDSGQSLIQGFIDGIKGMLGAVGDAVGGVMDFVGQFFPHSPAVRGQFSGSGWTRVKTAGIAIGGQLQAGLEASKSGVQNAVDGLVGLGDTTMSSQSAGQAASSVAGSGAASGIQNIVFDGLAAFKEAVRVEIEYHDGTSESQILSGVVL